MSTVGAGGQGSTGAGEQGSKGATDEVIVQPLLHPKHSFTAFRTGSERNGAFLRSAVEGCGHGAKTAPPPSTTPAKISGLRSGCSAIVERRADEFRAVAAQLGIPIVADEPLARHTTFRIGGPADLYAVAHDTATLAQLAELAWTHGIPYTVLGGGSNILVSDAGVRGLVIANQTRDWRLEIGDWRLEIGDWRLERRVSLTSNFQLPTSNFQLPTSNLHLLADSGVMLAGLARSALREGWAGLEWAVSVPGTVGGAVIGNAGAHGGCIADSLAWAEVYMPGQGRRVLTREELRYSYRSSALKEQLSADPAADRETANVGCPVVLAATFDLARGDPAELTARADAFLAKRRASQPVEPSAGSIFRNPPGDYAGRLIEVVGLKGCRRGGAQFSLKHANFIVNTGDARAADVRELIELAQNRVYQQFGVRLVLEIQLLGAQNDLKT